MRCVTRISILIYLLVNLLTMISCASQKAVIDNAAAGKIFWPGSPEKPRIGYAWSVSSWASDGGRFLDLFTGGADGDITDPQSAARLIRPFGIYVDEQESLFITDPGAFRVTVINTWTGELRHILKAEKEDFLSPIGVISHQGRIYVSDSLLKKVFIFDAAGKVIGTFQGDFERPTALALDAERKCIYLSDTAAHIIYKYTPEGRRIGHIGKQGTAKGEFNFPTHLWVGAGGELYVTDSMNFRVQIFSPQGEFIDMFGELGDAYGNLDKPKGIATDRYGNIYVVDSIKDMVKIFNREGMLLIFFGGQGQNYGQLYLPSGIFIRDDYIYVADTYNGRVQVFRYLGAK